MSENDPLDGESTRYFPLTTVPRPQFFKVMDMNISSISYIANMFYIPHVVSMHMFLKVLPLVWCDLHNKTRSRLTKQPHYITNVTEYILWRKISQINAYSQ